MVAMGTSLADRAWGRDSAVYRITGVITVVTGWFLTAIIASTSAGLVALLLMFATKSGTPWVGMTVVIGLGALATIRLMTSKESRNKKKEAEDVIEELVGENAVHEYGNREIKKSIAQFNDLYKRTLSSLFREDRSELAQITDEAETVFDRAKNKRKYEVLPNIERMGTGNLHLPFHYIQIVDYTFEVSKSLRQIARDSFEYINNTHEGFSKEQVKDLRLIMNTVNTIYDDFTTMLETKDYSGFDALMKKRDILDEVYFSSTEHQITRAQTSVNGMRNTILLLNIISETRTLILQSRNLMRSQRKLALANDGQKLPL
jgi:Na+/phosphate symporter